MVGIFDKDQIDADRGAGDGRTDSLYGTTGRHIGCPDWRPWGHDDGASDVEGGQVEVFDVVSVSIFGLISKCDISFSEKRAKIAHAPFKLWTRVSSLPLKKMVLGGDDVCSVDTVSFATSIGSETVRGMGGDSGGLGNDHGNSHQ